MKRVLLLDDDIDLCEVMVEMTLELGATACMSVNSLAEFKKLSKIRHRFDLIFIDMNLGFGEPSGIEVYEWLRQIGYNGEVAFFSGHDRSHPMIQMALEYPNVSMLEKPPSHSELAALLR